MINLCPRRSCADSTAPAHRWLAARRRKCKFQVPQFSRPPSPLTTSICRSTCETIDYRNSNYLHFRKVIVSEQCACDLIKSPHVWSVARLDLWCWWNLWGLATVPVFRKRRGFDWVANCAVNLTSSHCNFIYFSSSTYCLPLSVFSVTKPDLSWAFDHSADFIFVITFDQKIMFYDANKLLAQSVLIYLP